MTASPSTDTESRARLDRLLEVVPPVPTSTRVRQVAGQQLRELGRAAARRMPGLTRVNRPRRQPLRSGSVALNLWYRAPYGSPAKPRSLEEIPWDYLEQNEDKIPFRGLREYWYPAITSKQVPHNTPVPVQLLGDNLVLFRDADDHVRALENRCPHRSTLLSLGQIGVWEPGTITCRYHGMTFDGDGECVAYLADGPESSACGKVKARSYPVEEHHGIVFLYMGDREPEPFLDAHPHARTVFAQTDLLVQQLPMPYSHLNMLDNTVDLSHVGCLHRTCLLFSGQKPFGELDYEEIEEGRGLRVWFKQPGEHPGEFSIDQIEWFLPNLVYHAPDDLGGPLAEGYFWFVPQDEAHFTGWLIMGRRDFGGRARNAIAKRATDVMVGRFFGRLIPWPGSILSCLYGGDSAMQAAQGRVARWDLDRLARPDRPVVKVRRMMQERHAIEVAERAARAAEEPVRVRTGRSSDSVAPGN